MPWETKKFVDSLCGGALERNVQYPRGVPVLEQIKNWEDRSEEMIKADSARDLWGVIREKC